MAWLNCYEYLLTFCENYIFAFPVWYNQTIKKSEAGYMEFLLDAENQIETWQEVTLVYNAALKQINTKLEILNDEFQHVHQYNPIEHIKSRIKTSESIVKKLKRHGYESTIENMVKYVNAIAGIRVICSFTSDIYRIAEMIRVTTAIHGITGKE